MKKIICLILALLMVACLFAGCNKDVDPGKETEEPKASTEPKDPGETQADSKGTLKIGLLASLSGNAAVMGQDAKNALELYLEMNDYKIAGYDVELVVEDDEDNAETGVTKCTKLVEQDKVDIILGPQNAGQALGIKDYLADNEVPLLIYHAPVDPITKGQATDYIIRTQLSASQGTYPMGDYAYNTLGYHTAAVFTYDFTFGYQLAGGFIKSFQDAGGKITSRQYAPIGTTDFAPQLQTIDWDNTDVLVYQFSGGDGTRFCQALVDMGITARDDISIICLQNGVDELYLKDLPLELADVPFYSSACWALDCANKTNEDFVKLYNETFGHNPSCHSENTFAAMTALGLALETGVDPHDGKALVEAIKGLKNIEVPRGVIYSFDEYGQAVSDVCIRQLIVKDGGLYNKLVYTYPEVSQFWTYDPTEAVAWPDYSADFPELIP